MTLHLCKGRLSHASCRAQQRRILERTNASNVPRVIPVTLGRPESAPPAGLYTSNGRLVMPPPLRGTHEILVHQNAMATEDGLLRVQDELDLEHMRTSGFLVPIPEIAGLTVDERLPANRRYVRPWTAQFLTVLAREHIMRFHSELQVNSAVRTVEFQQHLMRINGNAAPADGETASPHLTGQAVDLAKKGLSTAEIAWLRGYLLPLVQEGKIDVEEEFQQSCFHISVYRNFLPGASAPHVMAERSTGGAGTAGSAAAFQ